VSAPDDSDPTGDPGRANDPGRFAGLRSFTRLRFLIPGMTLLFVSVGVALESTTRKPWTPLEIAPPPTATLPPLAAPTLDSALRGRIVGPAGEPVADALVFVSADDRPAWTYTERDGTFEVAGLARGARTMSIVARRYEPVTRTVQGESLGELELAARPEPASIPTVERATLVGRVVLARTLGPEEAPDTYEVQLLPTTAPEDFGGALPRATTADAQGRFELVDFAAGTYTVRVLPSWARDGSWPDLTRPLGAEGGTRYEHLPAGDGPDDDGPDNGTPGDLAVHLPTGAARGRLFDDDGEPLEGALLLLHPEGDEDRLWPPVATGVDGSFTLTDLPAGRFVLTIRAGAGMIEHVLVIEPGKVTAVEVGRLATRGV